MTVPYIGHTRIQYKMMIHPVGIDESPQMTVLTRQFKLLFLLIAPHIFMCHFEFSFFSFFSLLSIENSGTIIAPSLCMAVLCLSLKLETEMMKPSSRFRLLLRTKCVCVCMWVGGGVSGHLELRTEQ